jgi:hypothetical protein
MSYKEAAVSFLRLASSGVGQPVPRDSPNENGSF